MYIGNANIEQSSEICNEYGIFAWYETSLCRALHIGFLRALCVCFRCCAFILHCTETLRMKTIRDVDSIAFLDFFLLLDISRHGHNDRIKNAKYQWTNQIGITQQIPIAVQTTIMSNPRSTNTHIHTQPEPYKRRTLQTAKKYGSKREGGHTE